MDKSGFCAKIYYGKLNQIIYTLSVCSHHHKLKISSIANTRAVRERHSSKCKIKCCADWTYS